MEDLKRSHDEALQAAEQARGAVEQSRMRLQTTLAERTKLMSQLEQARCRSTSPPRMRQVNELSAPGNTPEPVGGPRQDRGPLRQRARQAELAQTSVEGRMLEVQKATLDVAGASRLDQIRASMSAGPAAVEGSQAAAAIEQGAPSVQQPAAEQREAQPAERPEPRPEPPGPAVSGAGVPPAALHRLRRGRPAPWVRGAGTLPELPDEPAGSAAHYLATGRDDRRRLRALPLGHGAPRRRGPSPHFHRSITESFFVLTGTVAAARRTADGVDAGPGDFLHVPVGGVHGFRNESGEPASMLLLFTPGAPREDYFETLADAARRDAMGRGRLDGVLPPARHASGSRRRDAGRSVSGCGWSGSPVRACGSIGERAAWQVGHHQVTRSWVGGPCSPSRIAVPQRKHGLAACGRRPSGRGRGAGRRWCSARGGAGWPASACGPARPAAARSATSATRVQGCTPRMNSDSTL